MQTDLTLRPISTLRELLLALVADTLLFSADEQLRANHNAHECESPARLERWLKNVQRLARLRRRQLRRAYKGQGVLRAEYVRRYPLRQVCIQGDNPLMLRPKGNTQPTWFNCDLN